MAKCPFHQSTVRRQWWPISQSHPAGPAQLRPRHGKQLSKCKQWTVEQQTCSTYRDTLYYKGFGNRQWPLAMIPWFLLPKRKDPIKDYQQVLVWFEFNLKLIQSISVSLGCVLWDLESLLLATYSLQGDAHHGNLIQHPTHLTGQRLAMSVFARDNCWSTWGRGIESDCHTPTAACHSQSPPCLGVVLVHWQMASWHFHCQLHRQIVHKSELVTAHTIHEFLRLGPKLEGDRPGGHIWSNF